MKTSERSRSPTLVNLVRGRGLSSPARRTCRSMGCYDGRLRLAGGRATGPCHRRSPGTTGYRREPAARIYEKAHAKKHGLSRCTAKQRTGRGDDDIKTWRRWRHGLFGLFGLFHLPCAVCRAPCAVRNAAAPSGPFFSIRLPSEQLPFLARVSSKPNGIIWRINRGCTRCIDRGRPDVHRQICSLWMRYYRFLAFSVYNEYRNTAINACTYVYLNYLIILF